MESTRRAGRVVGLLLLVHLAVGLMAPFIILDQVRGSASLLVNAAGSPGLFRTALLLLIVGSSMAIAVVVAGGSVFRRHSEPASLALVMLAVAAFVLQVVDTGALMSILAFSRDRASAALGQGELQNTVGAVISAFRAWVHYSYLLVAVSWMLLLNVSLFRSRLVPRLLAALAAAGCVLQLAGVSVPGLLGIRPITTMAMPLAPAYLGVALWLMGKGFAERVRSSS